MAKKQETVALSNYLLALNKAGLLEMDGCKGCEPLLDEPVSNLTFDSREVTPGTLFVVKGAEFQPKYLVSAVEKGAFAYVAEEDHSRVLTDALPNRRDMPAFVRVTDVRRAMPVLAKLFTGDPETELATIGVTGTKGKSTVTYYIRAILDAWYAGLGKKPSAVISGIDTFDGVIDVESHITTPESFEIYRHFRNAVDSGIEAVEMEVSSQALKYHRTLGIQYDVGVFMNIGTDHISPIEHADFEDYYTSKLLIFKQCETAVVNLLPEHAGRTLETALRSPAKRLIAFGFDDRPKETKTSVAVGEARIRFAEAERAMAERNPVGDETGLPPKKLDLLTGRNLRAEGNDVRFDMEWQGVTTPVLLTMPGLFNGENALAAAAACLAIGCPLEAVRKGLEVARVPGRMEPFTAKDGTLILVDYAHNRMSFEKLYGSIRRDNPDARIVGIYGCPGHHAYARRTELAEVAAKYADKIYITEEDYGVDSLDEINAEIAKAAMENGLDYEIIDDREEALRAALEEAEVFAYGDGCSPRGFCYHGEPKRTIILFTGKGRETREKRGNEFVPVESDVQIVEKLIGSETK
jgi:UDP-N-acetylmuramoyl-L-alanyl-D-glutamate--2,6-diaminopimelate ligase